MKSSKVISAGISRREALKQTFYFTATLALASASRRVRAGEIDSEEKHFLMIGDWGPPPTSGSAFKAQQAVASSMKEYARALKLKTEGVFLIGDNFYGEFKGGLKSPRWKVTFEDMYPADVFPGPCWSVLGNHDYDEEVGVKMEAELAYSKANPATRWTMPSKWYRFDWPGAKPLVSFLMLDSNYHNSRRSLSEDERRAQLEWLKSELAKPRTAPWLVCAGHHPLYSNGLHGDQKRLIEEWGPLFEEHKVDFYFAGHDHDLQHLEFEGMHTSFVLSGAGGARVYPLLKPDRGVFSQAIHGFSHLQVSRDKFIVRHIDANQKQIHAFSRNPDGKIVVLT